MYWFYKLLFEPKSESKSKVTVYNSNKMENKNTNNIFTKVDYEKEYQRRKFYFVEYTRKNGQYFRKGEAILKIRIGDYLNEDSGAYRCSTIYSAENGYLKYTQEYNNELHEKDIVYLLKAE